MVMAMETVAVALVVVTHGAAQDPRWPPPGSSTTASPASGSAAPLTAPGKTAPFWPVPLATSGIQEIISGESQSVLVSPQRITLPTILNTPHVGQESGATIGKALARPDWEPLLPIKENSCLSGRWARGTGKGKSTPFSRARGNPRPRPQVKPFPSTSADGEIS